MSKVELRASFDSLPHLLVPSLDLCNEMAVLPLSFIPPPRKPLLLLVQFAENTLLLSTGFVLG